MPKTYAIHSTVRSPTNRTQRAGQPAHPALKQYIGIGQRRLTRGKPILMSEAEFQKSLSDIRAKAARGILEVRTPDGKLLNLETLQPAPPPAPVPKPQPRPDSIANDLPWGQKIPSMPGEETEQDSAEPTLLAELAETKEEDVPPPDEPEEPAKPAEPEEQEPAEPALFAEIEEQDVHVHKQRVAVAKIERPDAGADPESNEEDGESPDGEEEHEPEEHEPTEPGVVPVEQSSPSGHHRHTRRKGKK